MNYGNYGKDMLKGYGIDNPSEELITLFLMMDESAPPSNIFYIQDITLIRIAYLCYEYRFLGAKDPFITLIALWNYAQENDLESLSDDELEDIIFGALDLEEE